MEKMNHRKYDKKDRIVIGTKALAEIFGVDRKWVEDLTNRGILEKESRGTYDLMKNVNLYISHLKAKTSAGEDSKSLATEKISEEIKLKKAKREEAELKVEIAKGNLHSTQDVRQVCGSIMQTFKAKILMLPVKVAPKIINMKNVVNIQEILEKEVYEALNELSNLETNDLLKADGKDGS